MKILFLSDNYPPETNAAASRVYERALHWVKWGHQVTILTSAPNKPKGRVYPGFKNEWRHAYEQDGIRIVRVKTFIAPNEGAVLRTIDFISYMFSSFFFGLFESRPDVVVATSPQFFTGVSGWLLSRFFRVRFVFEIADLWPAGIAAVGAIRTSWVIRMLERVELFLYRRARVVVTLTAAFRDDLIRRGIPSAKVQVIVNGVEMESFYPTPADTNLSSDLALNDRFVVGYLGTMGAAHGLENALEAAKILKHTCRVHFLFVGGGSELLKLKKMKETLRLSNVTFVAEQPKSQMLRYWSLCDLALISVRGGPVLATVIPSKIFEAMACGKPMVFTGPEGEGARIVRQSNCGKIVPANNPEILASVLRALSEDPIQMHNFALASSESAKNFSRQRQAEAMIEAFHGAAT